MAESSSSKPSTKRVRRRLGSERHEASSVRRLSGALSAPEPSIGFYPGVDRDHRLGLPHRSRGVRSFGQANSRFRSRHSIESPWDTSASASLTSLRSAAAHSLSRNERCSMGTRAHCRFPCRVRTIRSLPYATRLTNSARLGRAYGIGGPDFAYAVAKRATTRAIATKTVAVHASTRPVRVRRPRSTKSRGTADGYTSEIRRDGPNPERHRAPLLERGRKPGVHQIAEGRIEHPLTGLSRE